MKGHTCDYLDHSGKIIACLPLDHFLFLNLLQDQWGNHPIQQLLQDTVILGYVTRKVVRTSYKQPNNLSTPTITASVYTKAKWLKFIILVAVPHVIWSRVVVYSFFKSVPSSLRYSFGVYFLQQLLHNQSWYSHTKHL